MNRNAAEKQQKKWWLAAAGAPIAIVGTVTLLTSAGADVGTPRISALFPAGAKAGDTVEVSVRGGNLIGAKRLLITGAPGITGEIVGGNATVDESTKPLFQSKCTSCHEPRNPSNRSLTPEQWAATVDRMINQRGADIPKPDRDKIVTYLQAMARAGQVTAKLTVAPNAAPGMREVRVVTPAGTSSAFHFEVASVPTEITAAGSGKLTEPQKITPPVVVNGVLATSGERDYFSFDIKQGQRLTFNLKGYRLNEPSQSFFNPALYLYDAKGEEIARSRGGGKFGLDPVLDWTAPADGTYTVMVRDLLFKGSPSSVYRLTVGALPYDAMLTPAAGRPGETVSAKMVAASLNADAGSNVTVQVPSGASGVTTVATPMGDVPFLVRDLPDGGGPVSNPSAATAVALPALFRGVVSSPGGVYSFKVKAAHGGSPLELYARQLGSPLRARVTVKDAKGNVVATRVADPEGGEDFRLDRAFPAPGEYTVEVTDADGRGGASYAFSWDALDGGPDFDLAAIPDAINVPPGGSTTLLVRATNRENLGGGPITISLKNLPAGVTATPGLIPPDDDKTVIVLSAPAGTAAPDTASLVGIEGTLEARENIPAIRRAAQPVEAYRINNNPRYQPRSSQVVTVGTDPAPFSISLDAPPTLALKPGDEFPVKVKVTRRDDFKGEVILGVAPLPPGISVRSGYVSIPPDKTEGEMVFRCDGNARFMRDPKSTLPPPTAVIVSRPGGFDDLVVVSCTPPITLTKKE